MLCPGTQIDNIFELKKVPADRLAYFSSLDHNFLTRRGQDWGNGPQEEPDPSASFLKIWLAEQIFRLIRGLAEFLRKLQNSAERTAKQYKFNWHAGYVK